MNKLIIAALLAATAMAQGSSTVIRIPGYASETNAVDRASVLGVDSDSTTLIIACTPMGASRGFGTSSSSGVTSTPDVWVPGACNTAVPTTVRLGKSALSAYASSTTGTVTLAASKTCTFTAPTGPINCLIGLTGLVRGKLTSTSTQSVRASTSAGSLTITGGVEKLAMGSSASSSGSGTSSTITASTTTTDGGMSTSAVVNSATASSTTVKPTNAANARHAVMGQALSTTIAGYLACAAGGIAVLAFWL